MSDEAKSKRTRSPAYPAIDLEEAIAKAATLWQKNTRHAAALETASEQWGYDKNSSTGSSVAAALLKYGLIEDEGTGDNREIKLTEDAIRLTYNPDTKSQEYQQSLKKAALMPKIHAELWKKYGGEVPDDSVVKRYLVVERKFNEQYVEGFIKQFKKTITFANLAKGDTILEPQDEEAQEAMKPLVQLVPKSSATEGAPPAGLTSLLETLRQSVQNTPLACGSVLASYSIPLGENIATITFTGRSLSPADFDALIEYVELFKKQYERKIKAAESQNFADNINAVFGKEVVK